MVRKIDAIVSVARRQEPTQIIPNHEFEPHIRTWYSTKKQGEKRHKTGSAQPKQHDVHQTNAPHSMVDARLVLDVPRIRRLGSDHFLSVSGFASSGEVFTAPYGLEVVGMVAGPLKDPLLAGQRSWCKQRSEIDWSTGDEMRTA